MSTRRPEAVSPAPTVVPPDAVRGHRTSPQRPHRGRPHPLRGLRRWLRVLGPGLITGAADDDPSGIGTYSQAGAAFGTRQLWLALYMLPLMIAVQEMCGRIGLVTGKGLAAVIREHYSRWMLMAAVALVATANTLNIGADLGAMAATTQLFAPELPFFLVLTVLAVSIVALEVFVPYRRYAVVLKLLTASLLAYVAAGLIIGAGSPLVLPATLLPTIQMSPNFLALVVGVLGTTISPYLFFWQASEEVEELVRHAMKTRKPRVVERLAGSRAVRTVGALAGRAVNESDGQPLRRPLRQELRDLRLDTTLGMLASEIATWFIIYTTGSVLFSNGITNITTPDQAAAALKPLVHTFPNAGVLAEAIFAAGILGVGLLGVPVLAGSAAYAIAEAMRWHEGLSRTVTHARGFYGVIALSTIVGLLLNLFNINPMVALVYVAIINGIVAVPLLVMILLVANNRAIMGLHTNGWLSNVVGILTTTAMGVAACAMVAAFLSR